MIDDYEPELGLVNRLANLDERLRLGQITTQEMHDEIAALETGAELADLASCVKALEGRWPRGAAPPAAPPADAVVWGLHPALQLRLAAGDEGPRFGKFLIKRELGRGGFGVVFLAEDTVLGRDVALKLSRPELLFEKDLKLRFLQEAKAAAAIDHPHVAPVYEAGEIGTLCYLAAAYCPGETLAHWLARLGTPVLPQQAARLIETLAVALHYVHQQGILHRDLKPGNVLLWPRAESNGAQELPFVPKLTDFGLSKVLAESLVESRSSVLMGTPLYMAPEQAEGRAADIGPATDVYGLGAMLYELLTGRLPFVSAGVAELFDQIRRAEPVPPRSLSPGVPADLEIISLRCLEKKPSQRYASALALAEDLSRFRQGLPIAARPAGWLLRARKWRRRNPVAAVVMATIAVLIATIVLGGAWHNHRLSQALAESNRLTVEATQRETALRRELYVNDMRLAFEAASAGDLAQTRRLVERHRPQNSLDDYTGFEWRYLEHRSRPALRTMTGHGDNILAADLSPDGRWIASGDKGGEIRIWDMESGRLVKAWRYSEKEVTTVRFSPAGKHLATAGQDRTIRIWDTTSWQEIATMEQHAMTVCCVAWSADGRRLASAGRDQFVHIWEAGTWRLLHTLPKHGDVVRAAAWSPDGRLLATTEGGLGVQVWNTQTWDKEGFLTGALRGLLCLSFSPDSRLLAVTGYSGLVQVFDIATMKELAKLQVRECWSMTFLNREILAGDILVGGSGSEGLLLWLVNRQQKSLETILERSGGQSAVRSVLSAQNGSQLVTALETERVISVCDARAVLGRDVATVTTPLAILPSRGQYLSAAEESEPSGGALVVRRIASGESVASLPRGYAGCRPAVAAKANFIAVAENSRQVRIYETKTWQPLKLLTLPEGASVDNLDFSADEKWLAVGCREAVTGVWNLATGEWIGLKRYDGAHPDDHGVVRFSAGGEWVACYTTMSDGIEIWDVARKQMRLTFHAGQRIRAAAFSQDAKVLAIGEDTSDISLWDTTTAKRIGTLSDHTGAVFALSFSPDGRTLVSAAEDKTVRLWSLVGGRELFTLLKDAEVREIGFGADSSLLVGEEHLLSIYP